MSSVIERDELAVLDLPAPPLRVTALVPRRLPLNIRPGFWLFVASDGRAAFAFAMCIEDAARNAGELLPGAPMTECTLIRSEVGTPLY
jgi:hypothetical protein